MYVIGYYMNMYIYMHKMYIYKILDIYLLFCWVASPYLKELPMYTAKDHLFVRKSHQTQQLGNQEVSFQMWKDLQEVWSLCGYVYHF